MGYHERGTKKVEFEIEEGIRGWTDLNNHFFNTYNAHQETKSKIVQSFDETDTTTANFHADLYPQFFVDYFTMISGTTANEHGRFQNGGHDYTLLDFPRYLHVANMELHRLKGKKEVELKRVDKGGEELLKAEGAVEEAKKALREKETEIDKKITEKITELRKELKDKFKVEATTAPNFGSGTDANDANRLTQQDHWKLQLLISNIRFLVNNDEEKPTGIKNEDDAYTMSNDITTKARNVWNHNTWDSVGWDNTKSSDENYQRSNAERIRVIQENKDNEHNFTNLNYFHSSLEELEKLVKLDDRELQIKKDLKEAIDNQTPQDNIKDWQNVLKKYDVGLETTFNQSTIDKWKAKKDGKDAYNNLSGVETLIKKVVIFKKDANDKDTTEVEKVNEDFINFIKGKDNKLDSLSSLFKEKEPKEVITLLEQWVFNKLDDTKKTEYAKKFAWSELGGKQKVENYTLTEEDLKEGGKFQDFLYQCSIGKIDFNALEKPTEQDNPTQDKKPFHRADNFWMYATYGTPLIVIGLIVWFWKDIKGFFSEKEEGESEDNEA